MGSPLCLDLLYIPFSSYFVCISLSFSDFSAQLKSRNEPTSSCLSPVVLSLSQRPPSFPSLLRHEVRSFLLTSSFDSSSPSTDQSTPPFLFSPLSLSPPPLIGFHLNEAQLWLLLLPHPLYLLLSYLLFSPQSTVILRRNLLFVTFIPILVFNFGFSFGSEKQRADLSVSGSSP